MCIFFFFFFFEGMSWMGTQIWKWRTCAYWSAKLRDIQCKILLKKGDHCAWAPNKWVYFYGFQTNGGHSVWKNTNFMPKFAIWGFFFFFFFFFFAIIAPKITNLPKFMFCMQNFSISMYNSLQTWKKRGSLGVDWRKKGVIGHRIGVKKGL